MACVVVYFVVYYEFSHISDSHGTSKGYVLRVKQLATVYCFEPFKRLAF